MGMTPIPINRVVHFRLELTMSSEMAPVVIPGSCTWCRGIPGTDEYESGIAFDFVTGVVREKLRTLLETVEECEKPAGPDSPSRSG